MKKRVTAVLLCLLTLLLLCGLTASAEDGKDDETLFETERGGDLFGIYEEKKFDTTRAPGDLLVAGQELTFAGLVDGNLRTAGMLLRIGGTVTRNVIAAGQVVRVGADAETGFCSLYGDTVIFEGKADGLYIKANTAYLCADVGGPESKTEIYADQVYMMEGISVTNVEVHTKNEVKTIKAGSLQSDDGVFFRAEEGGAYGAGGLTVFTEKTNFWEVFLNALLSVLMSAVLTAVLAFVLRNETKVMPFFDAHPVKFGLKGFLLFIGFPLLAILLIMMLFSALLGIVVLLLYVFTLICAQSLTAVLFAKRLFAGKAVGTGKLCLTAALFDLGIAAASLIPVIGTIVSVIGTLFGCGYVYSLLFLKKDPATTVGPAPGNANPPYDFTV